MNHLISTHISEQINNFFMNAVLLCLFTRRPASFFTVRCCQSEAQPSFLNFKGQPSLLIIVGLAAALRVL